MLSNEYIVGVTDGEGSFHEVAYGVNEAGKSRLAGNRDFFRYHETHSGF